MYSKWRLLYVHCEKFMSTILSKLVYDKKYNDENCRTSTGKVRFRIFILFYQKKSLQEQVRRINSEVRKYKL